MESNQIIDQLIERPWNVVVQFMFTVALSFYCCNAIAIISTSITFIGVTGVSWQINSLFRLTTKNKIQPLYWHFVRGGGHLLLAYPPPPHPPLTPTTPLHPHPPPTPTTPHHPHHHPSPFTDISNVERVSEVSNYDIIMINIRYYASQKVPVDRELTQIASRSPRNASSVIHIVQLATITKAKLVIS